MEEQKQVEVSVIIPFYHGNTYMKALLRNLQSNAEHLEGKHIEAVIINDSPECEVIINREWCPDVFVRVICNERNLGIHQSRVCGIRLASGIYILMLDQDDSIMDNAIASQLAKIGDADIIVANGKDENPNHPGIIYGSLRHQKALLKRMNYFAIGTQIVSPGQCLIKKTVIPKEWMEHTVDVNGADDLLLWLLLLTPSLHWQLNPEVLYCHRDTGKNVSGDLEQMEESVENVIHILDGLHNISLKERKVCRRRFLMRRLYEGKGSIYKAAAFLRYPDIALRIVLAKCGM